MYKFLFSLVPQRLLVAIAIAVVDYIVEQTPTKVDDRIRDAIKEAYNELKQLAKDFGKHPDLKKIIKALEQERSAHNNS